MLNAIRCFFQKKMLIILMLGFSGGVPLFLIGSTLQAWLTLSKVDLTYIGFFSLAGLPYTLKFLWSPLLDYYRPPCFLRRRGWLLVAQIALFFLIVLMSFSNPKEFPILLAIIAFLVAFFGASQDIVFDAYRTEILKQSEYGVGSAVATFGYRIALIFSGAFALILSDHVSWRVVYLIMAASIGVGIIATLIGPELEYKVQSKNLKEVIFEPFFEFFKRKAVFELIGFIVLYKLDVIIALALMTPFLLELGFTATDIGTVSKGFGLVSGILGTFIGGFFLNCIGIHRSLWIFGILQAISGYCFFILAKTGYHYPTMVIAIVAENFFSGMGNAAYGAFFMLSCNPKYTATQYALLTSFMAITRTFVGFPTGWLAKHFGWENYFLIALFLSIPSFIFLLRFRFWMDHLEDRAT